MGLMKQEDFMHMMNMLNGAYRNFNLTENTLRTYYDYFKRYTNRDFWFAVDEWIRENDIAPTIHNLLDQLKKRGAEEVKENNGEETN